MAGGYGLDQELDQAVRGAAAAGGAERCQVHRDRGEGGRDRAVRLADDGGHRALVRAEADDGGVLGRRGGPSRRGRRPLVHEPLVDEPLDVGGLHHPLPERAQLLGPDAVILGEGARGVAEDRVRAAIVALALAFTLGCGGHDGGRQVRQVVVAFLVAVEQQPHGPPELALCSDLDEPVEDAVHVRDEFLQGLGGLDLGDDRVRGHLGAVVDRPADQDAALVVVVELRQQQFTHAMPPRWRGGCQKLGEHGLLQVCGGRDHLGLGAAQHDRAPQRPHSRS